MGYFLPLCSVMVSTLYSNNVYVNNLASLNTLLNGKASAGSILVQVYSTEVTKVLTNDSSYNRTNAQVWFTRASATGFQYIMVDYTLGEIYTGVYNPTSGATTKVYNFSKHPTRSEVDSLNNSMAKVTPQKITVSTSGGAASIDVTGMTASSAVVATVQRASNTDMNYRVYAQPASGKLWLYFRNSSDGTPADGTSITVSYSWA